MTHINTETETNLIKEWEVNPENYMVNSDGSFLLKKDGTPRKKSGRPLGSFKSVSQKLKTIKQKEKKIERLMQEVEGQSIDLPLQTRTTSTIPFGYKLNIKTNELEPIETELEALKEVEKKILESRFSLQDGVDYLKEKTKRYLSTPGLKKLMEKKYGVGCCSGFPEKNKGWIYVIECDTIPGWVKFGQTITPEKRLAQYNHTTPLRDYKITHLCEVQNKNHAEKKVLTIASFFAFEEKGEWKKLDAKFATKILKIYEDKYETEKT